VLRARSAPCGTHHLTGMPRRRPGVVPALSRCGWSMLDIPALPPWFLRIRCTRHKYPIRTHNPRTQVNKDAEAAGGSGFANTRNAASGGLRLLDPAECRRRRLSFVAYAALAPAAAQAAAAAAAQGPVAAPLRARHWDTLKLLEVRKRGDGATSVALTFACWAQAWRPAVEDLVSLLS
jgi:hypothetical protein